ncbi:hypothetical protein [Spongiibacter sp. UBA1325]|uniref:hypothetical protein n=1 Tax=Spongiibacter sp. UBA1325 TaxID=1947543 RepID=UPI00257C9E2F|nr:hypothetical protein [Spongiibacter sp. UBA1325]|tara:strand:+ start:219 stop:539 length:321 start_codon:yes stop_codon:yes gene_type:complete
MTLYNVNYLEHYADRFIELGLRAYGLSLEQYLPNPQLIEQLYLQQDHRPLLPQQRQVQQQLDAHQPQRQVEHLPQRNGSVIEPLHHKRRNKRSHHKSDFRRKLSCR